MVIVDSFETLSPLTQRRLAVLSIILTLLLCVLLIYFGIDRSITLVSMPDTYFVNPPLDISSPSPIGGELQTI